MEEFKNNKKFQSIVSKAKELFWKHGIKRISIEEICTETPVSKMTFYKFFKNKNELAEFILKGIMDEGFDKYNDIMNKDLPYPEKIKLIIILKHESSKDISNEFLKDIIHSEDLGLLRIIQNYKDKTTNKILNDLKKAQTEGWIRKELKPELLIYMMEDIQGKLLDPKLETIYANKHDLIMELTNYFFYGIMNVRE